MNNKTSTTESLWNGFRKLDFTVAERETVVVFPQQAAAGTPWIWRTRFFDAFPAVDIALVARGFHLIFTDLVNLYGNAEALAQMDRVYDHVTQTYGLAPKTVLEGFSRGGLPAYNWAAAHPDRVACIYADAPVCDIRSWPGGLGTGIGSSENWELCLAAYDLTEQTASDFSDNPIDHLEPLAATGIPILHVCGDADDVVPMTENTDVLVRKYRELGGHAVIIVKPGTGHHPHSLDPPDAIVELICTWVEGQRRTKNDEPRTTQNRR